MSEIRSIALEGRAAAERGEAAALATLLSARGSSFRRPGARVLFLAGRHAGAISGGCLERDLAERVPAVLATGRARMIAVDTGDSGDALWGTASGCGGAIEIILEPLTPERLAALEAIVAEHAERRIAVRIWTWDGDRLTMREPAPRDDDDLAAAAWEALAEGRSRVLVEGGGPTSLIEVLPPPVSLTLFGGGADAAATAGQALRLGWDVTLVDPALAGAGASFAGARLVDDLETLPLDPRSAVLVMTHSFHRDVAILGRLMEKAPGYVGVLGPRRRTEELLAAVGAAPPAGALRTPAGLDIGGESPEEIALSLIAEIQAHVAGRAGRSLSSVDGPIHEPVIVAPVPEARRR